MKSPGQSEPNTTEPDSTRIRRPPCSSPRDSSGGGRVVKLSQRGQIGLCRLGQSQSARQVTYDLLSVFLVVPRHVVEPVPELLQGHGGLVHRCGVKGTRTPNLSLARR